MVRPQVRWNLLLTSQGDDEQIYDWPLPAGGQYLSVLHLARSVDDTAWAMYTGQITPVLLRGPKVHPQALIFVAS